MNATNCCFILL